MISRLGAAPSHWLPTPSVWVDSNPHALVTDPNALGGEQVNLTAFVRLPLNNGWYVEASYAQPIYRDLDGSQSSEKYLVAVRLSLLSSLVRRNRSGDAVLNSAPTERWPSGRRRTPGKCVYGNVSRVRIPPSPPLLKGDDFNNVSKTLKKYILCGLRRCCCGYVIFVLTSHSKIALLID